MVNQRFLIVHADELGLAKSFNEGIREAYTRGFLTSASLRVNGSAFDDAINSVIPECPDLGIGLHLNIVEGRSPRGKIDAHSRICSPSGQYRTSFRRLLQAYLSRDISTFEEIEEDYRSQIEMALSRGITLNHLDSHQHSHAIPGIFRIVCKLANEYSIPYVRLAREQFHISGTLSRHLTNWYPSNIVKFIILNGMSIANIRTARRYDVRTNDWFLGTLYTQHMDSLSILRGLRKLRDTQDRNFVAETLLHPCHIVADKDESYLDSSVRDFVINPARTHELNALKDNTIAKELKHGQWKLTCYSCLSNKGYSPDQNHTHNAMTPHQIDSHVRLKQSQQPATRDQKNGSPLRTFVIIDETPFHHPEYLRRLILECNDMDICGLAIVKLPRGGALENYLKRHWRNLGLREMSKLAIKRILLHTAGRIPRILRGDHEGSIRAVAERFGIRHRTVSDVNRSEFVSYVRSFKPDVILSSNSLIFGEKLIKSARVACINRHSALLPSLGGVLPVFRAIQLGMGFTGASVHHVTGEIDGGPILSRKWVPIFPGDTLTHLYRLCFVASYEATVEAMRKLRVSAQPNTLSHDDLEPSYFSFPKKEDWEEFRQRGGRFI